MNSLLSAKINEEVKINSLLLYRLRNKSLNKNKLNNIKISSINLNSLTEIPNRLCLIKCTSNKNNNKIQTNITDKNKTIIKIKEHNLNYRNNKETLSTRHNKKNIELFFDNNDDINKSRNNIKNIDNYQTFKNFFLYLPKKTSFTKTSPYKFDYDLSCMKKIFKNKISNNIIEKKYFDYFND